jgi:hypothetical protein
MRNLANETDNKAKKTSKALRTKNLATTSELLGCNRR